MQAQLFKDLYAILTADTALISLFAPKPVRARFNMANQDEPFPYIVYGGKFMYDDNEAFASGTAFITFDVYDFRVNSQRGLDIINAIKNCLNRHLFQYATGYRVLRWYLVSQSNIPSSREDVSREEIIFKARFYDESLSSQVT